MAEWHRSRKREAETGREIQRQAREQDRGTGGSD